MLFRSSVGYLVKICSSVLVTGESHMYFVGEEAIADTDITQVILSCLTNTIFWSAIDSTGTFNSEVQHDL